MEKTLKQTVALATAIAFLIGGATVGASPFTAAYANVTPNVKTGEIQNKCIARWHDSQQIHSKRVILKWKYQAVKIKMKKLEHCVRVKVVGPVDVEGMAKAYVKRCVDYGLNHQRTRYILQGITAVVGDIYGGGGSLTAGTVTDYAKSVADNTLDCLTDTEKIANYFAGKLKQQFNATVTKESHWVYWEV